ncbi:hypothetical protein MMC22_001550 [Lobaria immixta]|nr:hypothetical protein [Lobaria immixta]
MSLNSGEQEIMKDAKLRDSNVRVVSNPQGGEIEEQQGMKSFDDLVKDQQMLDRQELRSALISKGGQ